jgi:WD40 repeat protein/predicted Ser/Thr protein kinase
MTDESRSRLWSLFDQAADLEPADQKSLLDAACSDDRTLRAEVEKLLAEDARLRLDKGRSEFLQSPVIHPSPNPSVECPAQVGPYRIVRLIGEGGMGAIYEAEQDNPRRPVALKMIRPGLASPALLRRFAREAHVLGRLHHPGIAQVFAAGVTDDGRPYFAMEFVRGVPLDVYVRSHSLNSAARLDLVARVCDAVQHAHEQSVIHRDLKPANILVNESGQPKILDFGVARATDADLQTTLGTEVGQVIGTLAYMSPEQVAGDPAGMDARSDVYALGVVLFQILSQRLPYPLQELPLAEAALVIRDREPDRLGSIDESMRGDLETVVAKSLEKDKSRRYESAGAMAADIRQYLTGQPVAARPASIFYQFRKFTSRNKAAVGGVAAAFVALLVGLTLSLTFGWREATQRRLADEQRQLATRQAYQARLAAAAAAMRDFQTEEADRHLREAPENLRGWEWEYLHAQLDDSLSVVRGLRDGRFSADFDPSLSGVIGFRSEDRPDEAAQPALWDLQTGQPLGQIAEAGISPIQVIRTKDDTRAWWTSADRLSWFVHPMTESPKQPTFRIQQEPFAYGETLAVSPDGTRFAAAILKPDNVQVAGLFDSVSGKRLAALATDGAHVEMFAFSPDGQLLAAGCEDRTTRLWDAATGTPAADPIRVHTDKVSCVAFSPDSGRLLTASGDGTVCLWDVAAHRRVFGPVRAHVGEVIRAAFSPDGKQAATGGTDATVRLWRTEDGEPLGTLLGHAGAVYRVAFSPDGRRLASAATDGTARLWEPVTRSEVCVLRDHTSYVYAVAYSPDGRLLATGGWDKHVRLWDAASGNPVGQPLLVGGPVFTLAISHCGNLLAAAGNKEGEIRIWDLATGRPLKTLQGHTGRVRRVAFSPDGRLASVSEDHTVRIWDPGEARELIPPLPGSGQPNVWLHEMGSVCFSPDGQLLATPGMEPQEILLRDSHTYAVRATLRGHTKAVCSVAFSPDGRQLVTTSLDGTVRTWDTTTGQELRTLGRHTGEAFTAVFSPDGSRIASGGRDRSMRLWDTTTGDELIRLSGHTSYIYGLAFSPDGQTLASGSGDCTVRLWDTYPLSRRLNARTKSHVRPTERE